MIGKLTENKFSILEISGYLYNFFPRLGGIFLNLAKKNCHFNHFFSELLLFRQRNATIQTSSDTPETKVIETQKNQPRKKHISKFSDLSYHYLIVLEKQG